MREKTRYNAGARIIGHAPYPLAAMADGMRLTGLAGGRILSLLIVKATGRQVAKEAAFLEVTEPLSPAQLAELCCLDERTIQRELKDLETRKIIAITKVKKGMYEFQPLFRTWRELPDYMPGPLAEPEAAEDESEEATDTPKESTITKITRKPVRIAAGKASKPVKVECGVSALEFSADVDAECSAVVQDGVLRVSLQCAEQAKSATGQLNGINRLASPPRQPCRDDSRKPIHDGAKDKRRRNSENAPARAKHPRAAELSSLFDAPIYQSCKKTLSGDSVALNKACLAVEDLPHDYLVEFLQGRVGRKILPMHVASICSEALHNWRKSGELAKRKPEAKKIDPAKVLEHDPLEELRKRKKAG
jgi:hypothetical protein